MFTMVSIFPKTIFKKVESIFHYFDEFSFNYEALIVRAAHVFTKKCQDLLHIFSPIYHAPFTFSATIAMSRFLRNKSFMSNLSAKNFTTDNRIKSDELIKGF